MSFKNALINLSICLSDIPKDKIKKSEKNGKLYLSIAVLPRNEPDQYGQDAYAIINQSKEERTANTPRIYIANGKVVTFNDKPEDMPPAPVSYIDDLPF